MGENIISGLRFTKKINVMKQFNLLVKYLSACELAYMGILTPYSSRSRSQGHIWG